MNYIYTNNNNGRKYILNPMLTEGNRVCLVDMVTCEDKFLAVSTLKRSYSRSTTEEVIVELRAFTGMKLGLFKLYQVNGGWTVRTKSGKWLDFNSADGVQVNAKNSKYANRIHETYTFEQSTLEWVLH